MSDPAVEAAQRAVKNKPYGFDGKLRREDMIASARQALSPIQTWFFKYGGDLSISRPDAVEELLPLIYLSEKNMTKQASDTYEPAESPPTFQEELRQVINRHSKESGSDTPDYILAKYLEDVLTAYNRAVQARESWFGR